MDKPVYPRPLCEHPVLIVNRRAIELMHRVGYYVYAGVEYKAWIDYECFEPNWKKWTKRGYCFAQRYRVGSHFYYNYDYEGLSNCYVRSGKYFEYLFILVECRKCDICVERRRNDLVSRCAFESQTSSTPPIMVTLTYEPKYLPHKIYFQHIKLFDSSFDDSFSGCKSYSLETSVFYRDGDIRRYGNGDVSVRDVQLFLKSLRTMLYRMGYPPVNLRYLCAAEYGSKHGRPHYHFLFWNVPFPIKSQFDQKLVLQFKDVVLKAWKMCEPNCCQCEVARSAARYCTKYMMKRNNGKIGFMLASRGSRGTDWKGIGSKYIAENKEFFIKYPEMNCIPFVDKWSGELESYTMGSYALNKIFPSASQWLSKSNYKHRYSELCYVGSYVSWLFRRPELKLNYEDEIKFIRDKCYESNFAYFYVNTSYNPNQSFVLPPDWFVSVNGRGMPLFCDRVANKYYQVFLTILYDFWLDFADYIDEDYLAYLDNIRAQHLEALPERVVTDSLVFCTAASIREHNVFELSKEIF